MADAPPENALQNVRAEWVPSDTSGTYPRPPTDAEWNRFGDWIISYPAWSGDAGVEGQTTAGSGDLEAHFRGAEEHDLAIAWYLQRFYVDGSGEPNDPIGAIIEHDYQTAFPTHEVLIRREVDDGGAKGAGFREFVYGSGCKPTSGSAPGDPSANEPIVGEAGYAAQKVRQYIVHQPVTSITPEVKSSSSDDTTQTVTIESEGASTTASVDLDGTTSVAASSSFSDIDAIWVDGDHVGDITVTDGNGNDLLETPIAGEPENIEADRGIPLLGSGSGSHSSEIGTDPGAYMFLGTSSTFGGGALAESANADRVHALDFNVDVEVAREAQQGTRRQALDMGTRTASAEADLAGPYESAIQNSRYFREVTGDLVYGYPDGAVTLHNSQPADTDDVDREQGDENMIYGITLEAHADGGDAITAVHSDAG
ncbi:hypothetical protein HZS55_09120 [Halosimplex rubrum]|uniref:Uncharacterized protein n=1 Tax=Halosimplex rubrum TaxID=869889 RepID=A0A7D5P4L6_9EURY|nr:hypothetical protein [Halosimplex rubrum]QLH77445.1 hypothetical protein HZS55_09120 [Halosimplex rubrum]